MKRIIGTTAALVLASTALAGCGAQLSAPEIVQHMRDTAAKTTSAHVVMTLGGAVNGQAANAMLGGTQVSDFKGDVTVELWVSKPNLVKAQILQASKPELVGAQILNDGTNFWAYEPQSKIAYKVDTTGLKELAGKANIPANLQDLLANPDVTAAVDQVLALTDATLVGNEKVGAYQTYRLDLAPKAGSPAASVLPDAKGTIWVDQESWVPVKATFAAKQGNGQMELTTLDLKPTLPANLFQFTMPAGGGKTVDLTGLTPHATTLADAQTAATAGGYSVLTPTYLPTGSTLVQVMASKGIMGQGASVIQNYSGGTTAPNFWVSQINGTEQFGKLGGAPAELPQDGQAVTVRGVQGTFASHTEKDSTSAMSVLWWKEAGTKLTVAIGGQVSQAELLKIAAGLK